MKAKIHFIYRINVVSLQDCTSISLWNARNRTFDLLFNAPNISSAIITRCFHSRNFSKTIAVAQRGAALCLRHYLCVVDAAWFKCVGDGGACLIASRCYYLSKRGRDKSFRMHSCRAQITTRSLSIWHPRRILLQYLSTLAVDWFLYRAFDLFFVQSHAISHTRSNMYVQIVHTHTHTHTYARARAYIHVYLAILAFSRRETQADR